MPNGIRLVEVSASIAQNDVLQLGTDKFGEKQALVGIIPIPSANTELIQVSAEGWGNRLVIIPSFTDPADSGGGGVWVPPIYPEVNANSNVTISGRQTGVGAETVGAILIFQIAENGSYPASVQRHLGELHTQFGRGTATNGNFPTTATATQDVLNEEPNDEWMPLMAATIGDTPGQVKFSHPNDDGFPPVSINAETILLGLSSFNNIPPTNVLRGADTLSFLAKDDSGSAIFMMLYTGRVSGGKTVLSNRSPFGL